jgi:hypothetical protein
LIQYNLEFGFELWILEIYDIVEDEFEV